MKCRPRALYICALGVIVILHFVSSQTTKTDPLTTNEYDTLTTTNESYICPTDTTECTEEGDGETSAVYYCCNGQICCNDTSAFNASFNHCGAVCNISITTQNIITTTKTTTTQSCINSRWKKDNCEFNLYFYILVGGGPGVLLLAILLVIGICCCKRKRTCCFRRQPDRKLDKLPSADELAKPGLIKKDQKRSKPNDYTKGNANPPRVGTVIYEDTEMQPQGQEDYENVPRLEIYENNPVAPQHEEQAEMSQPIYGNIGVEADASSEPEESYLPMDQNSYRVSEQFYQPPQIGETAAPNTDANDERLVGALLNIKEDFYRKKKELGPPVTEREEEYSDVQDRQANQFPSRSANQTYYADTNTGQTGEEYADARAPVDEVIYENVNR